MDQTTHEVRLTTWKAIVNRCQARPEGQSARQWLADNNIPEKQYYYWLRLIRARAYDEMQTSLPSVTTAGTNAVSFAEIPNEGILPDGPVTAVVIKTGTSSVEISTAVSDDLMVRLVKAVTHAL